MLFKLLIRGEDGGVRVEESRAREEKRREERGE